MEFDREILIFEFQSKPYLWDDNDSHPQNKNIEKIN